MTWIQKCAAYPEDGASAVCTLGPNHEGDHNWSPTWDALEAMDLERVEVLEARDQQTRSAEAEALWAQLPEFMNGHMVIGLDPDAEDLTAEGAHAAGYPDHDVNVGGIEEADMIASYDPGAGLQRPVLDIDFPAALVPSTTPGHFHLYLDKPMSWEAYKDLLLALARADIIEDGYAQAALRRGYTSARLPWIRKPEPSE